MTTEPSFRLRETVSNQVTISFDTEDPDRHAMLTSRHVCVCVGYSKRKRCSSSLWVLHPHRGSNGIGKLENVRRVICRK